MALSTTIPSIAIKKIIPVLETQVMQLIDITLYIETAVNSLPFNVKCNDPRIQDIKQQLINVQQLNANIAKIKSAFNKLSTAFNTVYGIAQGVEIIQLAIPAVIGVPQGPFAKLANIASVLGKNCKSAGKCLSSILASLDTASSKLGSVVAAAVIKLTTVCSDESFVVTQNVQNDILKLTEQSKPSSTSVADAAGGYVNSANGDYIGYTSKFYNQYNVSQEDMDDLENIIFELNELQLTITDYLLEAPSAALSGNTPPAGALGKIGDFYIDLVKREIYGPKTSDITWDISTIKY